ncbi:MAG: hypothetical protein HOV81_26520 [Kofleriaceae bacterium]|nr:hypothetical protein [Kofleriaceae bacterium]
MKRFMLAFGLLGLVGCFLPLLPGISFFDLRHFDAGWTVWAVIGAFALPAYVGGIQGTADRSALFASVGCFGYLAYKFGTGVFDLVFHGSIGAIMMGVAIIGGLASSALALASSKR